MNIIRKFLICVFTLCAFFSVKAQQSPPPAVKPGLEIPRDTLMKAITNMDSTVVFKKGEDINSLPNFIGTNIYKSAVQIVGNEDDLKLAKWTFYFSLDPSLNKQEALKIGYFGYLLGQRTCVDWFKENVAKIMSDPKKGILETKNFNFNRKGEFSFNPNQKTITLSFTEW